VSNGKKGERLLSQGKEGGWCGKGSSFLPSKGKEGVTKKRESLSGNGTKRLGLWGKKKFQEKRPLLSEGGGLKKGKPPGRPRQHLPVSGEKGTRKKKKTLDGKGENETKQRGSNNPTGEKNMSSERQGGNKKGAVVHE